MAKSRSVLIVDDDVLMRNLYERLFKLSGFMVEVAKDGAEGLKKADESHPDLILLDIMMPKMNGFDVLAELKKGAHTKKIPVIMLSNLAQPDDVEKSLKLGAAEYVIKSDHSPKEIVKIVEKTLAK